MVVALAILTVVLIIGLAVGGSLTALKAIVQELRYE